MRPIRPMLPLAPACCEASERTWDFWLDWAASFGHPTGMRKRRIIVLAVAIVAVLGGWIWWALWSRVPPPPNPVYDGHPLSQWVDYSGFLPSPVGWDNPAKVPRFDSNAVPYLIQTLSARDSVLRKNYFHLWLRLPAGSPRDWLSPPVPAAGLRANAADFLARIGKGARPAIPALLHVLREDGDVGPRMAAAQALTWIADRDDKPVLEALAAAATKDPVPMVRTFAGLDLKDIDPEAAVNAGITNPAAGTSP